MRGAVFQGIPSSFETPIPLHPEEAAKPPSRRAKRNGLLKMTLVETGAIA